MTELEPRVNDYPINVCVIMAHMTSALSHVTDEPHLEHLAVWSREVEQKVVEHVGNALNHLRQQEGLCNLSGACRKGLDNTIAQVERAATVCRTAQRISKAVRINCVKASSITASASG